MSLALHLLTGADLQGVVSVEAAELAAALGPRLRPATAFWISARCGRYHHEFLRDDRADGRVPRMAAALLRDFGRRHAPLIIAPGLGANPGAGLGAGPDAGPGIGRQGAEDEEPPEPGPAVRRRGWTAVLAQLQAALAAGGAAGPLQLRGLALAPALPEAAVLAGLEALAAELDAAGVAAAVPPGAVAAPAPGSALQLALLRNMRARILCEEVAALGRRQGMEIADPARLLAWCDSGLQRWAPIGLVPAVTDRAAFARLGERLFERFAEETRR